MPKIELQGWTLALTCIILIVGGYQVVSMIVPGMPGFDDVWNAAIGGEDVVTPWETEKPEELPDTSHLVKVTATIQEQDVGTAVTSGVAYIWYDMDKDGAVDVGSGINSDDSEVEMISLSTGEDSSARVYWTGATVGVQVQGTGMYVRYVERVVPDMGIYTTTVPLTAISVWDVFTGASATAADQGLTALATGTDYNYTTSGTTLTMTLQLSMTVGGEGFGQEAYTDWDTGYDYIGPFISIKLDNTDTDLVFSSDTYSTRSESGSYIYYTIHFSPFFNDADITSDGFVSFKVVIDIQGAGDFDITFYDGLRADFFDAFNYGSADESTLSDIDIVA